MSNPRALRLSRLAVAGTAALLLASLFAVTLAGAASTGEAGAANACAQARVPLGAAGNFRVLGGTTVTSTGATVVTGTVGLSPGSAVTGFPPATASGGMRIADPAAAHGQAGLLVAYNNAMGRTHSAPLVPGNLGGRTLGPGLYDSTSTLAISSGAL